MFEKMSVAEVETKFKTSIDNGLSSKEANRRIKLNGKNVLMTEKKDNFIKMFANQLNDPMIYILMVAVVVSLFLREFVDVFIILAVVFLNAIIGVIQESKAEKALEALKNMTHPVCAVRRDGEILMIKTEELVVGDIVELEAGQKVPADIRLVESKNLKIVESSLTGESIPSAKNAQITFDKNVVLGDKENMAFMSTSVVNGRGEGIVVATSMNTEIGKIAKMLKRGEKEFTPLQKKLSVLGKFLGGVTIGLCVFLLFIGLLQKRNLYAMLLTSISLAVAAIPEGLPAVVTIVLSVGVQRMARVNAIVRKLSSVETLGAVNVVCSDKTGTLTQNKMTVEKVYVNNKFSELRKTEKCDILAKGMMLCNDANYAQNNLIGDPTEIALIRLGEFLGFNKEKLDDKYLRVDEMPFDSNRKMMSTLHKCGELSIMFTKGAVEEVIKVCDKIEIDENFETLSEDLKKKVVNVSQEMASNGLRVLALAYKNENNFFEKNMTFVGMVGMKDPIREEAKKAVETFRTAGIKTVMITGDHIETAFSIAKELGIADQFHQCIKGAEIEKMSQKELETNVANYRVFARVSPENKVSIVKALKANGMTVAMTGDGVNDAPSLKRADVGIAMGVIGTDVAKEAADIILNDDNFSTIEKAVEEGRVIYSNIKKSVLFLLSSNFAEIVAMLISMIVNSPVPLLAIHILWINLITDSVPALALGNDPKEEDVMKSVPRKSTESLFANGGWKMIVFYGMLIGLLCLFSFFSFPAAMVMANGENVNFVNVVRQLRLDEEILRKAQTFAFVTLSSCELFHALAMRNSNKSFVRKDLIKNKLMIASLVLGLVLQWIIIEIPFMNKMFKMSNMNIWEWCFTIGVSLVVLIVHEIVVIVKKK